MRRSRFTEEQIISSGSCASRRLGQTDDVCRKHGISPATFLPMEGEFWRPGGVRSTPAADAGGGGSTARLKKLLADAMLDNAMLKDVAAKKW